MLERNLAKLEQTDGYFDKGMRGCIVNMARKHYQRIASHDITDLIEEGIICFYHCRQHYVGKPPKTRPDGTLRRFLPPTNPDNTAKRHFMMLVKHAFSNRISTLAQRQPRRAEIIVSDLMSEGDGQTMDQVMERLMPEGDEVVSISDLIVRAPSEIQQLFKLLVEDALALTGHRRLGKNKRSRRETTNQYFCRLLGLPSYDIRGQVEQYFLG